MSDRTILQAAADVLRRRGADLAGAELTPLTYGIHHGLQDLAATTGHLGAGEEHRTSAAMGLIAAHVSWYQTLAEMSGVDASVGCVWGAIGKDEESEIGADFGVAIDLRDETYNVCCFQAKNGSKTSEQDSEGVSLDRVPDAAWKVDQRRNAMNERLKQWLDGRRVGDADRKDNHQIVKMALLDQDLRELHQPASRNEDWKALIDDTTPSVWSTGSFVHYVIWRNFDRPALVAPLDAARDFLKQRGSDDLLTTTGIKRPTMPVLADAAPTFAALLASGQQHGATGWARLPAAKMEGLIRKWTPIGLSWLIAEQRGGGLLAELQQQEGVRATCPERLVYTGDPILVLSPKGLALH